MKYLHAWAIERYACLIVLLITLLIVLPYSPLKTG